MDVLVPGMEETVVRSCIPGYHGTLSPIHRYQETPNSYCSSLKTRGLQCPESQRTPNPKASISYMKGTLRP